jgi:four helix bundle protein
MYTSLGQKKLEVYQQSPEFITWRLPLLDTLSAGASVRNQLDRASISVPLNIAEGKSLRLIAAAFLTMHAPPRSNVPRVSM